MNDEQIVDYCRKLVIANLEHQPQDFTREIMSVLSSDNILLDHCYGIKQLMIKCIEILESKGVDSV